MFLVKRGAANDFYKLNPIDRFISIIHPQKHKTVFTPKESQLPLFTKLITKDKTYQMLHLHDKTDQLI